jgi:hypothetical protein
MNNDRKPIKIEKFVWFIGKNERKKDTPRSGKYPFFSNNSPLRRSVIFYTPRPPLRGGTRCARGSFAPARANPTPRSPLLPPLLILYSILEMDLKTSIPRWNGWTIVNKFSLLFYRIRLSIYIVNARLKLITFIWKYIQIHIYISHFAFNSDFWVSL